jgi:peptidoglycan/xylan/chitin deacetylase (PgdA/CDA1 family)
MALAAGAVGAVGAAAAVRLAPAVTALAWVRRRLTPGLSGFGDPGHVALTFDDGPDPASTPHFLELLERFDVRATFFVLGAKLHRHPGLGRELVAAGHELAVHGWSHRQLGLRRTGAIAADLARTRDLVTDLTGTWPRWYRPPYGILTTPALLAAGEVGLVPVLWSNRGREWAPNSTVDSVARHLRDRRIAGGTVLLHDAGADGGWARALAVLPGLLAECAADGLAVGPLSDHGIGGT